MGATISGMKTNPDKLTVKDKIMSKDKLTTLSVRKGAALPLRMYFSNHDRATAVACSLREAGFEVDGLYGDKFTLNANVEEALETAKLYFR